MGKAKRVYHVERDRKTGRFVIVNGAYVRKQASEAVSTFFAPVSGAWEATKRASKSARAAEQIKR